MEKIGKTIKCKVCGKSFYCKKVHLSTRKYCSFKCYGIAKKEQVKGKNNPFYGKKHTAKTNEINRQAHLGKTAWNKGLKGYMAGSKNSRWKGGRYTTKEGYIYLLIPKHHYSDKRGYIAEHRYVCECALGRFLTPQEQIHHINGIKDDNRPENLYLFPNRNTHQSIDNHRRKNKIILTSNII